MLEGVIGCGFAARVVKSAIRGFTDLDQSIASLCLRKAEALTPQRVTVRVLWREAVSHTDFIRLLGNRFVTKHSRLPAEFDNHRAAAHSTAGSNLAAETCEPLVVSVVVASSHPLSAGHAGYGC